MPFSKVAFKDVDIEAPLKKGKYELYALLALNPWIGINIEELSKTYIYTSVRLTLVVE